MSEYIMNYTGEQLDEAIDKVLNEYIKPEGTLNITEKDNNTEVDVTRYALAKVQIPIPTFTTANISIEPQEGGIIRRIASDEGCDGFSEVAVSPISSTYIGSGVPKKEQEIFTPKKDVQQVIPAGRFLSGDQIIDKIPDEYLVQPTLKKYEEVKNLSSTIYASSSYNQSSVVYTIPSNLGFTPRFYLFSPQDYNTSVSMIVADLSISPILTISGCLIEEINANLGGFLKKGSTYYDKASYSASSVVATRQAGISYNNTALKLSPDGTQLYLYNSSVSKEYLIKPGAWRIVLIGF